MNIQYAKKQFVSTLLVLMFCLLLFCFQQFCLSVSGASVIKHIFQTGLHINPPILLKKNHLTFITSNTKKNRNSSTITAESGINTPWSNAFNFKKVWGTAIDP
ncbi:MAG: hypothetical protein OXC48_02485, partial [Endozoicomonadaceae bacterium]|nr:hypothetical protein [Endozoicomonadaceae bacterium]